MGSVVTKEAPVTELTDDMDLLGELERAKIEWPRGSNKYFIPRDRLETIVNSINVRAEIKRIVPSITERDLERYINIIFHPNRKAKGVFITVLQTRKDSILKVLDEGLTDSDLALERQDLPPNPGYYNRPFVLFCLRNHYDYNNCRDPSHSNCRITGIGAMSNWSQKQIEDFDAIQWRVKAPVFEKLPDGEIQHLDLHQNIVMPYVDDSEFGRGQLDAGGYSDVWAVQIHPAHQSVYKRGGSEKDCPRIAVKRLHSRERAEFEQERKMLRYLTLKHHQHLVKLLATYTWKGSHHLLFPFADANLRSYWRRVGIPARDLETYTWCIDQLAGLASGLNVIHNFQTLQEAGVRLGSDTGNDGLSRLRPSGWTSIRLVVDGGESIYGRHGDLKPENVLWFNETGNPLDKGILQITDLGLGRFHGFGSKSRDDPRKTAGSATYVPPELALDISISRAYDIWSLGCVFLEFATWMVEGYDAVREFSNARFQKSSDGVEDDTFFTQTGNSAVVRAGVIKWVQRLRQNRRCSGMIHTLLDLTINRMLRIRVGERINSIDLKAELKKILEMARRDTGSATIEFVLGR